MEQHLWWWWGIAGPLFFAILKIKVATLFFVDMTCAEVVVAVRLFALTDQAIWVDHVGNTVNLLFRNINLPTMKTDTFNQVC